MERQERVALLKTSLKERILVVDGATGTALQNMNLTAKDFGGDDLDGCNENLNMISPDAIREVHRQYLEAGADIVETNTFGGTPLVLSEYDLQDQYYEINVTACKLAREMADKYTEMTPDKPRFVAASVGPTTKAISVTGGITFEELEENFYKQALALYDGGVDYYLVETCQDTRNIKSALIGINRALEEKEIKLPVAVSGTIEPTGTMLGGQNVEALITSLEHVDLLYIGINCATGPDLMTDHIRTMSDMSSSCISCLPNAGLPDEDGNYLETPAMMEQALENFIDKGWLNVIGGCCGTNHHHIKAFSELAARKKPRVAKEHKESRLSGVDYLEITDEMRPILVGERTNVIGSKKFKNLITDKKFDEAAEIAKNQVKKGAHIIDVCLANPDSDELEDMELFLEKLIQKIRVPLMIDSTDTEVVKMALTYSQGKAIINSINLEDGESKFDEVVPLAKKFGAALVVGTIDEDPKQGMAVSRERKVEIATRCYDLLVNKHGFKEEDIFWDPLVFPCATGDENYVASAIETIEGIRLIKEKYPKTKTVLGLSNVSFGLPPAGREVLNSVFLYLCTKAGLDMALVNTQKLKRYSSLTEEEITLAEDLLHNRGDDPITIFADFFRGKKTTKQIDNRDSLPINERIGLNLLEGTKQGLTEDLDILLKTMKAIDIINGPLMNGMGEVGKLFNANQLIVAEVLQSAEVMKTAVAHLEPHMEEGDMSSKAKILLATVKGDVHDIGKNLVDIILSNNGFEVIDMGIKITSEQLIEAYKEHNPDIIGLSGLLVKSAQQMILTADDFSKAGIKAPIMVGGAALSKNFVNKRMAKAYPDGTVFYAKDAMTGLELCNKIIDKDSLKEITTQIQDALAKIANQGDVEKKERVISYKRSPNISDFECHNAPDYIPHTLKNVTIDEIFRYINPLMLYGRHLGIKGKLVRDLVSNNTASMQGTPDGDKAMEIYYEVEKLKQQYKSSHLIPKGLYQFFFANSEKNSIFFYDEDKKIIEEINFPRQDKTDGLSLSDYVPTKESGEFATMGMFVVSVGEGIREEVEKLKKSGQYLASHILASVALESAEAYAELIHSKMRSMVNFPDDSEMPMMSRFQARYQGKRYSFGYPACPDLDNQQKLFKMLTPTEKIGVKLTEGNMMEPEASVSAIMFQHPEASYFSVGKDL